MCCGGDALVLWLLLEQVRNCCWHTSPFCKSNTLVRAMVGVVPATFRTLEFGGSIFW